MSDVLNKDPSKRQRAWEWSFGHERVRVEAWGADSLRVRVAQDRILPDVPSALLEVPPDAGAGSVTVEDGGFANGKLGVKVTAGQLRFFRTDTKEELMAEQAPHFWWPGARLFLPNGNGYYRLEQRFRSYEGEKMFGLGQHLHGRFDQKGLVIDLVQRNCEVSIPFLLSSRGYGFLWNSPAVGRVELAENGTRWVADSARQIDYWMTAGDTPAEIIARYGEATGRAPEMPSWATGFWQSKLRYRTQDELMTVAREYRDSGIPLAVIVADFFHWPQLGDWRFEPTEWPDPAAMVAELEAMGTKLMVSVWPSVSPLSENYETMMTEGLLVKSDHSLPAHAAWPDRGADEAIGVAFYDPTNESARRFIWGQVREHYYDLGIRVWWLDACEPEMKPGYPAGLRFSAGPGLEVANIYPREHARAFFEGMQSEGDKDVLLLCRSAWAGSQRYGVALWSGDIPSTFESLRDQVRAGLNVALSGIPWWNTDIGGFHGGDPESKDFRELIVRWFQYGVFSPICRLHGDRQPTLPMGTQMTGGPNEIWSYGNEVYSILRDLIFLRERLRPYIRGQMHIAHTEGLPMMRPLLLEFPSDPLSWDVDDEFMFGPDLLVAPVTALGSRERHVYLPEGSSWVDAWTGVELKGGTAFSAPAPLERVPLFLRGAARLPIRAE